MSSSPVQHNDDESLADEPPTNFIENRRPKVAEACTECRRSKQRCNMSDSSSRCVRCQTRGIQCIFNRKAKALPTATTNVETQPATRPPPDARVKRQGRYSVQQVYSGPSVQPTAARLVHHAYHDTPGPPMGGHTPPYQYGYPSPPVMSQGSSSAPSSQAVQQANFGRTRPVDCIPCVPFQPAARRSVSTLPRQDTVQAFSGYASRGIFAQAPGVASTQFAPSPASGFGAQPCVTDSHVVSQPPMLWPVEYPQIPVVSGMYAGSSFDHARAIEAPHSGVYGHNVSSNQPGNLVRGYSPSTSLTQGDHPASMFPSMHLMTPEHFEGRYRQHMTAPRSQVQEDVFRDSEPGFENIQQPASYSDEYYSSVHQYPPSGA